MKNTTVENMISNSGVLRKQPACCALKCEAFSRSTSDDLERPRTADGAEVQMNIQITAVSRCLWCGRGATKHEGGREEIMSEEEVSDGGGRGRRGGHRSA